MEKSPSPKQQKSNNGVTIKEKAKKFWKRHKGKFLFCGAMVVVGGVVYLLAKSGENIPELKDILKDAENLSSSKYWGFDDIPEPQNDTMKQITQVK